jgi:hypothetical protein
MRVRIVCYEEVDGWILGKFAKKLNEELLKLGVNSDIAKTVDVDADINHHIIYLGYDKTKSSGNDTLMITHIDDIRKLNQLKSQLAITRMGICMSKSVVDQLIQAGLPAEKLCYVSPAHDQVISFRPYTLGITSKVQPDGCKREDMLLKLSEEISPAFYNFKIMGAGWEDIIKKLEKRGFQVTYYPQFIYDEYIKLVPSLDYYLYFGMDEGSMGFIDALAAGVKTIVTPQGYHLDAENGIVHPFITMEELIQVFQSITKERQKLIDAVATWTWRDYAIKHLELWNHVLAPNEPINSIYKDGVNSLNVKNISNNKLNKDKQYFLYLFQLYVGAVRRTYYKIRKIKDYETLKKKAKRFF